MPTIVLDCRWLGIGGPGRTTELVLRGLGEAPPAGRWVLWGTETATSALAWPGAEIQPIAADPRLLLGQRHAFQVPRGDLVIFMHQQRPLRSLPSITVIYDTIPLRYAGGRPSRELRRIFLRRVARTSRQIVTISDHSKVSIVNDLGVAGHRIELLRFPFDHLFANRVVSLRASLLPVDAALFIGNFLPHKNLPRLITAFGSSEFCRGGGRLVLVGGTSTEARILMDSLDEWQRAFVTVRHSCTQAEIDRLYATCLLLVQPSLEEGFGLPAWEAMCCGLPVCASDGGSLPEVTGGFANPFPARSVAAMRVAIDATVEAAREATPQSRAAQSERIQMRAPSIRQFGVAFQAIVAKNLDTPL